MKHLVGLETAKVAKNEAYYGQGALSKKAGEDKHISVANYNA